MNGINTHHKGPVIVADRYRSEIETGIIKGTAFSFAQDELNELQKPIVANARNFAGVASEPKSSNVAGTFFQVAGAGSRGAEVAVAQTVAVGDIVYPMICDGSSFYMKGGKVGKGAARVLEANTNVKLSLLDGSASVAADGKTVTVADTSDLEAGMYVECFASSAGALTGGRYEIASVTNSTVFVLKTLLSDTLSGAITFSMCAYQVMPMAIVEILDGDDCGFIQLETDGIASYTPTGVTILSGNIAMSDHVEIELAAGEQGDEKIFKAGAAGNTGSKFYKLTLPNSGVSLVGADGSTALTSITIGNHADAIIVLKYIGSSWFVQSSVECTEVE